MDKCCLFPVSTSKAWADFPDGSLSPCHRDTPIGGYLAHAVAAGLPNPLLVAFFKHNVRHYALHATAKNIVVGTVTGCTAFRAVSEEHLSAWHIGVAHVVVDPVVLTLWGIIQMVRGALFAIPLRHYIRSERNFVGGGRQGRHGEPFCVMRP